MESQNVEIDWRRREGPFPLLLGPGVFSPTTTSRTLADALEITPGDTVIDVGCGSGVLSIVAAKLGAAKVYGVDLSQRAAEAAKENARRLGLDHICEFRAGDLLEPVRRRPRRRTDRCRAPGQVPAFDRRHPRDGWPTLSADGHDPRRTGDPRRCSRDIRRPHAPRPRTGVPAAGSGRQVEGRRPHDEGRLGQLPSARQPVALAAPHLALRSRLTLSRTGGARRRPPPHIRPRASGPRPRGRSPARYAARPLRL